MLKNLVVVGGGFAGTRVTRALEHTLPPDAASAAMLHRSRPCQAAIRDLRMQ